METGMELETDFNGEAIIFKLLKGNLHVKRYLSLDEDLTNHIKAAEAVQIDIMFDQLLLNQRVYFCFLNCLSTLILQNNGKHNQYFDSYHRVLVRRGCITYDRLFSMIRNKNIDQKWEQNPENEGLGI